MSLLFTISDLKQLVSKISLRRLFEQAIAQLRQDFSRWQEFQMVPRIATHYPHGVIELMPVADNELYSFKYVNGHPYNPRQDKLTVTAVGMLANVATGYPLLISEMTLLTAIRTAATSALASTYLAPQAAKTFGMIGTGSQSEFQTLAHQVALGIEEVFYFDIDGAAMDKFAHNLADSGLQLQRCDSIEAVVAASNIITTATADKVAARILQDAMIDRGKHINAIGGDCPGKTEIAESLLKRSKIIVEYLEQSLREGEIQNLSSDNVYAELWQLVCGEKPGRESADEVTVFDSVGIALEDYSVLKLIYRLMQQYQLGKPVDLIPDVQDSKDIYSIL